MDEEVPRGGSGCGVGLRSGVSDMLESLNSSCLMSVSRGESEHLLMAGAPDDEDAPCVLGHV